MAQPVVHVANCTTTGVYPRGMAAGIAVQCAPASSVNQSFVPTSARHAIGVMTCQARRCKAGKACGTEEQRREERAHGIFLPGRRAIRAPPSDAHRQYNVWWWLEDYSQLPDDRIVEGFFTIDRCYFRQSSGVLKSMRHVAVAIT